VLPPQSLADKLLWPLMLGGGDGHSLALDFALKPLLAALGGNQLHAGLYLIDKQLDKAVMPPADPFVDGEAAARCEAALGRFLAALTTR
jgi:FMN reductase